MDPILRGQFVHRFLTPDGGECHPRFEFAAMLPSLMTHRASLLLLLTLAYSVVQILGYIIIQYVDAGATSYTAIALFKALLIEGRNQPSASYETILTTVLTRQDATGSPRVEILEEDLRAGGVPVGRATELAVHLNTCMRFGIERVLGTQLPRIVRAGRFRVTVHDATGAPVSRARVGGIGQFTAASECQDPQGAPVTPIDRVDNRIVCRADEAGRITFILEGEAPLVAASVAWSVRSSDGTRLLGEVNAPFVPTATLDAPVTVPAQ